ncbi:putative glutathione-S-transferase theta, GST [Fusarium oxysporum]|nr:putative glutathione-S-transferase theta, GST [Fusarium oxysporum]
MAIKLYGHPASLCTRRVLLVLAEKGIDYEFINVNFIAGEQKKPPYEEMMVFGQIPALEDGSLRLYAIIQLAAESRAIARYLSSKYRDQGWALFEKFASVEYSQVFDAALQVLYLKFFNPVTKLHAKLDVLDKILATQDYLGGAEFTVVDILYMPAMQMLRQAGQIESVP